MAEIKLTINGKEATGEKGDSVLKVCEKNDIYVPNLCHHRSLTDTGACRLCLVEIEGQRGYRPACSTEANDTTADIGQSDCILMFKVDLDKQNRVAGSFVKLAVYQKGANLILVDDGKNSFDRHAVLRLSSDELNKAKELLGRASKPIIIYDTSATDQEVEKLSNLCEKAKMMELVAGSNAKGLLKLGINGKGDIKGAKALYILACDEGISGKLDRGSAEFVVLQASYMTPEAEKADIILPSPLWSEKEGSITNIDNLVQKVARIVDPPEYVWSNEKIIKALADKIAH